MTILLLAAAPLGPPAAAAPGVTVSIAPLHSLVAAVMQGVATPDLLVPPGFSPHTFALRPSNMRGLYAADMVVWVGESLEAFLAKPLAAVDTTTVRVADLPDIHLLAARSSDEGRFAEHEHSTRGGRIDPHLWLDPDNARVIVRQVAVRLTKIDPAHARRYQANAQRTLTRLDALDASLARRLQAVANIAYVTFHDAYRYFEAHYGLHSAGSITMSPEISPGARRIMEVRDAVTTGNVRCVFGEPQFKPALVETVIEGTGARHGVLDPEGADIPPGPDAYFLLMERLAASLSDCLGVKPARTDELGHASTSADPAL